MKIMLQNRQMIIEQPRCLFIEPQADGSVAVASNARAAPALGTYPSMDRAKEVLNEIFQFQRNGKYNYYMPEQ